MKRSHGHDDVVICIECMERTQFLEMMKSHLFQPQNLAKPLQHLQIRFHQVNKRHPRAVLRKRDAVHAEPTSDIQHFLSTHAVRIERVIPPAMIPFNASRQRSPALFPFRQQLIIRQRQQFFRAQGFPIRDGNLNPFRAQRFVRLFPVHRLLVRHKSRPSHQCLQLTNQFHNVSFSLEL